MKNVEIEVTPDNVLIVKVKLDQVAGFTRSNNVLFATTNGNVGLPGPDCSLRREKLNLSVWRNCTPIEKVRGEIMITGEAINREKS